ncbi:MAG: hypothetical protein HY683_08645 [Chloroflexi bacterium]|nr:hypothetical protein [Chloroflexota bacterium]
MSAIILAHVFSTGAKARKAAVRVVLVPAGNLVQAHGRGRLLSTMEKDVLLTRLRVFPDGRVYTESTDWNSYWQPLHELGYQEIKDKLDALHGAWRVYIETRFAPSLRREFCFRYFCLLDALLSHLHTRVVLGPWTRALQTALGFECFQITSASSESDVLGAGTSALRNPCYLLAKLKMTNALEDPQFLPLITVAGPQKPGLYYHYRQYRLAADAPMVLLLYPAVSEARRSASFKVVNSLIRGVSDAIDPWTPERARQLWQGIIWPIIQSQQPIESGGLALEFVDVGAGSGSLTAALCRWVRGLTVPMRPNLKVRLWFVDLNLSDSARFFHNKRLRDLVDSLMFVEDDYRSWLSNFRPLPDASGLRIALMSKLLDTMSHLSIRRLSREELNVLRSKAKESLDASHHLPERCLHSSGGGPTALLVSSSRVPLQDGSTYAQPSLSGFYQGLHLLLAGTARGGSEEEGVYLPVRTFNQESLVTSNGQSVLARVVELCDYVVIEDADLSPNTLVEHMTHFSLHSITVRDMTKAMKLTGNYAYVLWPTARGESLAISVERIW